MEPPDLEQPERSEPEGALSELTFAHCRTLIDSAPFAVGVFRADSDDPAELRLLYANPKAEKQTGRPLTRMVGKRAAELFPERLASQPMFAALQMFQRVAVRGQRERMNRVQYGTRPPVETWFDVLALPLGDRTVAVLQENITSRLRTEQAMRSVTRDLERSLSEGERRFRSIFATASVGLFETDLLPLRRFLHDLAEDPEQLDALLAKSGELLEQAAALWPIHEVNDAALRLTGVRDRGELPRSFGQIVLAASGSVLRSLLLAVARGAPAFDSELCVKSGTAEHHVLVSMAFPPDEQADLAHVVVSMADVTERKRLERELWTAQRMEAVGHLTGGVAHDFNNLLMVITSYANFVRDQLEPGSAAREDVAVIQDAADRAAELTNQLLAFGRRQVQRLELLDLNQIVSGLEKMLRRVIGEHIELVVELAPELGLVNADRVQSEQILLNLAINASDAMPHGGRISIATANVDVGEPTANERGTLLPAGAYVRLAVRDTGEGMDDTTRARIFEPFFSTKERGRGTGLGLSTVYGMVKQSQGHIAVSSELDSGATFEIYLPRAPEQVESRAPTDAPGAARSRETVLLVEDEEMVRVAARRILERHGYVVLEAKHGPDALALCEHRGEGVDLLVTDMIMPQMNGRTLAEKLLAQRPELKVVFVSGYADKTVPADDIRMPGTRYVQKPFSPDVLLRAVRDALG